MKDIVPILSVVLILCATCADEPDYVRNYPQMLSTTVTDINTAGATATALISDGMLDQITDHGFVWVAKTTGGPLVSNGNIVRLGKPSSTSFTTSIVSGLLPGRAYNLRAFAVTGDVTVYSITVEFVSQGSTGVIIESVSPTVFVPGDRVTIKGSAFGESIQKSKVEFVAEGNGRVYNTAIQTISDKEIVVLAPTMTEVAAKVRVSIPENLAVTSTTVLQRKVPRITSMTSTDLCSPFQLIGEDLLLFGNPTSIAINGATVTPMPVVTATSITIPARFHASSLSISIVFPGFTATKTLENTTPWPRATGVQPSTISQSGIYIVTGTNLPVCGAYTIVNQPGGLTIESVTSSQITVSRSGMGMCDSFRIRLAYLGREFYSSDPIVPLPAVVTSFSSTQVRHGNDIIIRGSGLMDVEIFVATNAPAFSHLRDPGAYIAAMSDTQLVVTIYDTNVLPVYPNQLVLTKCGIEQRFDFTFVDF